MLAQQTRPHVLRHVLHLWSIAHLCKQPVNAAGVLACMGRGCFLDRHTEPCPWHSFGLAPTELQATDGSRVYVLESAGTMPVQV